MCGHGPMGVGYHCVPFTETDMHRIIVTALCLAVVALVVPASDAAFIDAGRTRCIGRDVPGLSPPGTVEPLPTAAPPPPRLKAIVPIAM